MSTRVKKTSSVTATSSKTSVATESSTPVPTPASMSSTGSEHVPGEDRSASSPSSESRRSRRSASPGLIDRLQEKKELATLNDRLANYIDRVRQLELEHARLERVGESKETSIKALYDGELAATRKMLDDIAGEKAKLQVEVGKFMSEVDDYKEKLKAKEDEAEDNKCRKITAEMQLKELQTQFDEVQAQRSHTKAENNKLKAECESLSESLAMAKRQLETETISRVDLENRCQSLLEEISFLKEVHKQELNESLSRAEVVINEADYRLKKEYDNQLRAALLEVRDDMDEQLQAMREETETVVKKLQDMSTVMDDNSYLELSATKAEVDELKSELTRLKQQNSFYEERIRSLEDQMRNDQKAHHLEVDALNAELRHMRAALSEQQQLFQDLIDVKVQLDGEIAMYRSMLEAVESMSSPAESRKRKLDESDRSSKRMTPSYNKSYRSTAKDVVQIEQFSPEEFSVKLSNTSSSKDVPLSGWQLRQRVNNAETNYEFPNDFELKALQSVTVWSAKSNHPANPPTDLLMNNEDWLDSSEMTLELVNQMGEEMACLEKQKVLLASTPAPTGSPKKVEKQQSNSSRKWKWLPF